MTRITQADLLDLLTDVREEISGFVDVTDGSDGPRPNWAMKLAQRIDDVLDQEEPCLDCSEAGDGSRCPTCISDDPAVQP